jgi:hypothetical protein
MEFWDNYELVATVKKNDKNEVRIAKVRKGAGTNGVDIRTYYEKDGEYIGTGKGVFISENNLSEFVSAVNKLTRIEEK